MSRSPAAEHRVERRARARGAAAVVVAGLAAAGLVVTYVAGGQPQLEGLLAGAALAGLGTAMIIWAHHRLPDTPSEEERHAIEPGDDEPDSAGQARRRLLLGAGATALTAAGVVGLSIPGRRWEQSLHRTAWRPGTRLVTSDGQAVGVDDLAEGGLLTVWPEGATDAADSQAVLIRLDPVRMTVAPGRETWSPEGYVAYSKLCTHMGCPVGLYQQDPKLLLCPCHQAAFDVLDGARPVAGPASRPLPQLPLGIDGDGALMATGDFPDAVGPGFWNRPR